VLSEANLNAVAIFLPWLGLASAHRRRGALSFLLIEKKQKIKAWI